MNRLKTLLAALTLLVAFLVPSVALAAPQPCTVSTDPLACACAAGANASSACDKSTKSGDPISGPHGALKKVSLIIATVAGIAAVIVIMVAGFQYVTSGGDSQQTAKARNAIIGASVGLIIIVTAESILLFVVSKL